MLDYLTQFFYSESNQLMTMFISAFGSATILPGNSEVIFSLLSNQLFNTHESIFSSEVLTLLLIATLGNSLGGLTIYGLARLFPPPDIDKKKKSARWALQKSQQFGAVILLFSWVPIIGDILCGVAGWLRWKIAPVVVFTTIGKSVRYIFILAGIWMMN